MHELAIVETLIDQVAKELQRVGQEGPVARLELSVGRLSGVNCESLRFAFKMIASGTILDNTELWIEEPKAVCQCRACQAKTEIDDLVTQCPRCQSGDIVIEGGRDLTLQSIDLED